MGGVHSTTCRATCSLHSMAATVLQILAVTLLVGVAHGNMYDVIMRQYTSTCKHGCADWGSVPNQNQSIIDAMFAGGKAGAAAAGSSCAMPANHAGDNECDCGQKDADKYIFDSYQGPWCYCKQPQKGMPSAAYCQPPQSTPEQINLQVASPSVVVVGFVTYEHSFPAAPPVAMLGTSEQHMTEIKGVSRHYAPPGRTGAPSKD